MSCVAGIVDRQGGLRIVVTERWRMALHVGSGEQLFIVPGLEVNEPVPRDQVPGLIEAVHRYVHEHGSAPP